MGLALKGEGVALDETFIVIFESIFSFPVTPLHLSFCLSHFILFIPFSLSLSDSHQSWSHTHAAAPQHSVSTIPAHSGPPRPSLHPPRSRQAVAACTQYPPPEARPSPYSYMVPAFVRAHPPVLPKIFQPSVGSGTRNIQRSVGGTLCMGCCESQDRLFPKYRTCQCDMFNIYLLVRRLSYEKLQ